MQAIVINLVLGVFWLFFGGAILVAERGNPFGSPPFGISFGWWCMVLALYNTVKLLINWSAMNRRREMIRQSEPLSSLAKHGTQRPEQPPDPNFQFTEKPPPAPDNTNP
jgi:hypothetical protein